MPDISTPNLDYNDMVEAWDINDALMGGTLEKVYRWAPSRG